MIEEFDYLYINNERVILGRNSAVEYTDETEGVKLGRIANESNILGTAQTMARVWADHIPYGLRYSEELDIQIVMQQG